MGLSAVCDCGISWSYSLTIFAQGPQRSDAGEAQTRGPSVLSQALYNCALFLTLGVGLGASRYPGGQKIIVFQHGHVAYQIDGDTE